MPARRIDVAPARFARWISSFGERHGGGLTAAAGTEAVLFRAADGATATCEVPFPPLAGSHDAEPGTLARDIAAHACADRTVGVLLVRLGGYAAGVFTGQEPVLASSKVGSRLVHGRSAAGGQSQRRFARRRENQAHQALAAAADTAAAVFGPHRLDAVVLGGDRRAIAGLRADPRLAGYFEQETGAFLTVPDPRLAVLRDTPRLFRAIRISLTEPPEVAHTG
ncbi:MAG TPA: acVLRF1 family peptidyl-tRNA hydrolase [Streptosporangiaceae bacterium]|nr:acVLRF1 family peptidyl-tRNA hydrolase [Streptosporangiaceae bacterium]